MVWVDVNWLGSINGLSVSNRNWSSLRLAIVRLVGVKPFLVMTFVNPILLAGNLFNHLVIVYPSLVKQWR